MSRRIINRIQDHIFELEDKKIKPGNERKVRKIIDGFLDKSIESIDKDQAYTDGCKELLSEREEVKAFTLKLMCDYFDPINLLEIFHQECYSLGNQFVERNKENKSKKFKVITALFYKAVSNSDEIICLIKNGFASGALARWRTLFEVSVTSVFLAANDEELAKRYLSFETVERYNQSIKYMEHYKELGFRKLSVSFLHKLEKQLQELKKQYGDRFIRANNWASCSFSHLKGDISFRHIAGKTDLNYMYPYYTMACDYVHSGAHGIFYNIGLISSGKRGPQFIGRSNIGFADPAQLTCFNLLCTLEALFSLEPKSEDLIGLWFLRKRIPDIANQFSDVEKELFQREKGRNKKGKKRNKSPSKL